MISTILNLLAKISESIFTLFIWEKAMWEDVVNQV